MNIRDYTFQELDETARRARELPNALRALSRYDVEAVLNSLPVADSWERNFAAYLKAGDEYKIVGPDFVLFSVADTDSPNYLGYHPVEGGSILAEDVKRGSIEDTDRIRLYTKIKPIVHPDPTKLTYLKEVKTDWGSTFDLAAWNGTSYNLINGGVILNVVSPNEIVSFKELKITVKIQSNIFQRLKEKS
mgnify:CR=1 FL=1